MAECQYASIDEVKQEANLQARPRQPEAEGAAAAAAVPAARVAQRTSDPLPDIPPPLPPPNKLPQDPLAAGKPTAVSDENVRSSDSVKMDTESLRTSVSSPHLSSMAGQAIPQEDMTDGVRGGGGGGGVTPLYAVVKKKPKSSPDSNSVTPPPLPPPLVLEDGDMGDGLILVPENGPESKPRRPVPLPRSHVYEVVPEGIAMQESPSLSKHSSRKATKKKKSSSKLEKEKRKSQGKTVAPLISLNDLEPLPSGGESMRLQEFVDRFSHYLPLRVKVDEGYCGTEERFVISSGDVYNFHFVKTERVASIRDCGGSRFSIPLNSAIEFGALYNPSNDFKAALQGYTFKTVSELAGCKQIPRVVCATKAHQTGESKSSVHANEILVVRKVGRTTVMRKPVLKAFSVKNNEDKTLQEDCEAHFSTSPDLLRLYLPEILEHFGQSLPLEAMLYMRSFDSAEDLPLHLTSDVVTLTHTAIESSIIASTCWEYEQQGELSEEDQALVAIPTDLDIEVMFLGRESDDEQLYESTRSYFEKFRYLKITDMKNSGGMQRGEGLTLAQKKLYKAVRKGYEAKSTEIKMPYRISGVFDGEISPIARSLENHTPPLPEIEEGRMTSSLNPSLPNGTNKITDHGDHLVQSTLLPPTENLPVNHSSSSSSADPCPHTGPAPLPDEASSPFSEEVLGGDLDALYSAIDDIFDATIREVLPGSGDAKPTPKSPPKAHKSPPRERQKEVPAPTVGASSANTPHTQAPKPFPRTRSQTELKPTGERSSKEVNGYHGDAKEDVRIMSFEELSMNYSKLQLEVQELRKELETSRELEAGYDVVSPPTMRVRTLPRHPPAARPVSIIKASNSEDQERNRVELKNLDHMEVISLLTCMNLDQYREQFMREQVDGEILAECDEAMLETELNIHSAIHRTRLLKVITGRHSALSFLREGADLYSTLDHRI